MPLFFFWHLSVLYANCGWHDKSTLGILMWFVVSTVIAYHIGILDQNPMLGTLKPFPVMLVKNQLLKMVFFFPSVVIGTRCCDKCYITPLVNSDRCQKKKKAS